MSAVIEALWVANSGHSASISQRFGTHARARCRETAWTVGRWGRGGEGGRGAGYRPTDDRCAPHAAAGRRSRSPGHGGTTAACSRSRLPPGSTLGAASACASVGSESELTEIPQPVYLFGGAGDPALLRGSFDWAVLGCSCHERVRRKRPFARGAQPREEDRQQPVRPRALEDDPGAVREGVRLCENKPIAARDGVHARPLWTDPRQPGVRCLDEPRLPPRPVGKRSGREGVGAGPMGAPSQMPPPCAPFGVRQLPARFLRSDGAPGGPPCPRGPGAHARSSAPLLLCGVRRGCSVSPRPPCSTDTTTSRSSRPTLN
eukprot:COSAG01_NODE_2474_length_7623_cov_9.861111_3_plen_317_part_00